MNSSFTDFIVDEVGFLGEITCKKMFSSWGLYCDGFFFAIISDGVLYLKTNNQTRIRYEKSKMKPFTPSKEQVLKNYMQVPDEILEKPGALNEREFAIMQGHSFESHHILKEIDNLQDVALWCSQHHEKINGKGYPFCNKGNEISRPARILAVADVFQALAQNRPYRASLNLTQILSIMDNMINGGKLEPAIVQLIHEHPQESLTMAMGADENITF